ncbi:universal stress protein [Actinoplanes sp. N902-109]|uniref:universal stress protein n=1 Tax=Actinoplanes sp. (strain N902-109) TaxID=649831 RepID=UPI0003294C64|nr:universal stress protein [Actinoplanes sp. N902-109]AGL16944.1 hypothetical protein L083_3434 [Actinoplanes sp. N902-109]
MDTVGPIRTVAPVVVGVDGVRNHLAAVELAAGEAERRHVPLLLVHVLAGESAQITTEAEGQKLLCAAADHVRAGTPGVPVGTELAWGNPGQVLVEWSRQARLIVVGHRDVIPVHARWGSTAAFLARRSACPVLVRRGGLPGRGPVVVVVQAAAGEQAAIGCAFHEAGRLNSRLVAVHVHTGAPGATPIDHVAERQEGRRFLAEALAGWAWTYPDVPVERVILDQADITYTMQRAARRSRLLVTGIGSDGGSTDLVYDPFGLVLSRQAACPVLLVPSVRRPAVVTVPAEALERQ